MNNNNVSLIGVVLTTDTKLRPYQIIRIEETSSVIHASSLTIFVLIALILFFMVIKFILKQSPIRPVDLMYLVDQVVLFISNFIVGTLTLTMLWSNHSIKDLFGSSGCWLIKIFQPTILWQRALGSLGITTFRYLFMNKPNFIIKHGYTKIILTIWSVEYSILITALVSATAFMNRPIITAFCEGIPFDLYQMMIHQSSGKHACNGKCIQMYFYFLIFFR